MLKPTPAQRRRRYMRTVRRKDYYDARTHVTIGNTVKNYEAAVNARTSRPVMTPIDMGAGMVVTLPLHYRKG